MNPRFSAHFRLASAILIGLATTACTGVMDVAKPTADNALPARDEASCARLANFRLADVTVDSVTHVKADAPVLEAKPFVMKASQSFCRVGATLTSGPGSSIRAEFWLPDAWNGKLFGMGGGGFNGGLDAAAIYLNTPLGKGYAGAVSDAGHPTAEGAQWAHNEPAKVADWASRANHATATFGKALANTYYGEPPRRAYFEGCSNGGRDALMLAQRHPDDYDGIISGAPAADWIGLLSSFIANQKTYAAFGSDANAKFALVHDAILGKCDTLDGVKDGVLERPYDCKFDPAELQCKSDSTSLCLTKAEADAARTIYQGQRLADGRQVFAGFSMGGEKTAQGWRDASKANTGQMGTDFYRWMVYGDPSWNPEQFNLDRDYAAALDRLGPVVNANDPDLTAFTRRGGKLLLWHGWNDASIPAEGTIQYFEAVKAKLGPTTEESVRLFMAPGVDHCFGGDGPPVFDRLEAIERWVEQKVPPSRIIATKYTNDVFYLAGLPTKPVRTRPLCPWPQSAHYNGAGSTDDAANFTCRAD
jgi:pimeloyl-ACP methyl ester carboxylesterase